MSQGPLNPGFMQKKVQKGDFLKNPQKLMTSQFQFKTTALPAKLGLGLTV